LEAVQHKFHSCNSLDLEESIQNFVERKQINMIAMVAKNLNFFQRILFRPTVKKMSYQTKIPFLVLHE
ncbi:MAG TPA: universal stress protein, partial [Flavobacteriaceae bacterium]|nr:universal stress protein [Flavobacteriaceae bacterium]